MRQVTADDNGIIQIGMTEVSTMKIHSLHKCTGQRCALKLGIMKIDPVKSNCRSDHCLADLHPVTAPV